MNLKIYETDKALEDAISIADYLAKHSSFDTSDQFLEIIKTTYRQLASLPGMGAPRNYGPHFSDLRVWPVPRFSSYLIFYRATETELIAVRVLHGAQNIPQIFNPPATD